MRVAVVCASNMNRSMEAHAALAEARLDVSSFGVGATVKLPGPSARTPNVYAFGTPYARIRDDLREKDADLCAAGPANTTARRVADPAQPAADALCPRRYTRNGLLPMLERNAALKEAPERWQANSCAPAATVFPPLSLSPRPPYYHRSRFDVVFTFEERVFDAVVDDLAARAASAPALHACLVLNIETHDSAAEARAAAPLALQLAAALAAAPGGEREAALAPLAAAFEQQHGPGRLMYSVAFY